MGRFLVDTFFGFLMIGYALLERQDAAQESARAAMADSSERLQSECEYWHSQATEWRQRAEHLEQQMDVVELANAEEAEWSVRSDE